jgi:hypothetical protein
MSSRRNQGLFGHQALSSLAEESAQKLLLGVLLHCHDLERQHHSPWRISYILVILGWPTEGEMGHHNSGIAVRISSPQVSLRQPSV